MKINRLAVTFGISYLLVNCLNDKDYQRLSDILIIKSIKAKSYLKDLLNQIDLIINLNYEVNNSNEYKIVKQKINLVEEEIKKIQAEKLGYLILNDVNKRK